MSFVNCVEIYWNRWYWPIGHRSQFLSRPGTDTIQSIVILYGDALNDPVFLFRCDKAILMEGKTL